MSQNVYRFAFMLAGMFMFPAFVIADDNGTAQLTMLKTSLDLTNEELDQAVTLVLNSEITPDQKRRAKAAVEGFKGWKKMFI